MKKLNIAIYSRKSKFTGKGESTENQIEMCKAYLLVKFPEQYCEKGLYIYEDEGFSGAHINRPKFLQMMRDARESKFDTIICYRLDRISRNISDFAKLIDELNNLEIAFISIKEQFDTSQPMGRAMMYIASIFSQLERETIGERIKDNMEELAKDGRWLGGITPTGYRSVKITEGKKHKQMLETISHEAKVVKYIFEEFVKVRSLSACVKILNQKNILSKNTKPFSPVSVRGILENPVYMKADSDAYRFFCEEGVYLYAEEHEFDGKNGIMAYKKTYQKAGKANQRLNPSKWIIAIGQHEGIVSGKQWVAAYRVINAPVIKNDYALLSGMIKCGLCGARLNAKKRSDKKGFYYLCAKKCGVKNLAGRKADGVARKKLKPSLQMEVLSLYKERALVNDAFDEIVWDGKELNIVIK